MMLATLVPQYNDYNRNDGHDWFSVYSFYLAFILNIADAVNHQD